MKCTNSLETFLVFMFFWGGREGGRERLGQILQFGSKKPLFSFQFPTWQKDKKCDVLPKEKQKPSPPNKREKEM